MFFLIELNTRQIVQWGITEHPNHTFVQQQMLNFIETNPGERHLIHDHGPELFHFPYQDYGITNHPTAIVSPNLNAYAERFVRSIRRECLDHFILGHQRQLRTIVGQYIDYYNDRRPHQGIGNAIPSGQPPDGCGEIRSRPVLFGLYHDFYRSVS